MVYIIIKCFVFVLCSMILGVIKMKVSKFGGSSLATAEQIKKVSKIVLEDKECKLVVVSAPGKRFEEDIKVTDLLIDCANKYIKYGNAEEELNKVINRFKEIMKELNVEKKLGKYVEQDLRSRILTKVENNEKLVDLMKAAGEDNSARILAEYLKTQGVKATYIDPKDAGLLLNDEYGNARVLQQSYENLKSLKEKEGILIFPGFFGYSPSGNVVTFPRGGSDITGSILAVALGAHIYENYTDVDSIFVANPKIVKNPKPINLVTYSEMRELSYAGFSVLHEETLEPVYKSGIPVLIKNTNNITAPGTLITNKRETDNKNVIGIATDTGFCSISFSKFMMNREIGFGSKLLNMLENQNISYQYLPSGIDSVFIILKEHQLTKEKEAKLIKFLNEEIKVEKVNIDRGLSLIILVGEGIGGNIDVAVRAITVLANNNIDLQLLSQCASKLSIMLGVKTENVEIATNTLYKEFFSSES